MSDINIDSIMRKVEAASRTPRVQAQIRDMITQMVDGGVRVKNANGKVMTKKKMYQVAEDFMAILRDTAQKYDVPESVMRIIENMKIDEVNTQPDGSVLFYFSMNTHRNSLAPDRYGGTENIVALLNNGYHASDYTYGLWEGHPPTGAAMADPRSTPTAAYIRSRKDFDGLHFMEAAVDEFNRQFGVKYRKYPCTVEVTLGSDYHD